MAQPIMFLLSGWNRNLGPGRRLGVPPPMMGRTPLPSPYLVISGVTKDSAGVALGSCVVDLFRTVDDLKIDSVTSDGSGNYEFRTAGPASAYYLVAYKAGAPDVAGTTVNTLTGNGG